MKKFLLYFTGAVLGIILLIVSYFIFFLYCPLIPKLENKTETDSYELFIRKITNVKYYRLYAGRYMYKTVNTGDRVYGGFSGCSQIAVYSGKKLFVYHFTGFDKPPEVLEIVTEHLSKFKNDKQLYIELLFPSISDDKEEFKTKLKMLLDEGGFKYKIHTREYFQKEGKRFKTRYYYELMVLPIGIISKLTKHPVDVLQNDYMRKNKAVLFFKKPQYFFKKNLAVSWMYNKFGESASLTKINNPDDESGYSLYQLNSNENDIIKFKSSYEYVTARTLWSIDNNRLKYYKIAYGSKFFQKELSDEEIKTAFSTEKLIKISQFKDKKLIVKKPLFKQYQAILLNDTDKDFNNYKIEPSSISNKKIRGLLTIKHYGIIKLVSDNDEYIIYVMP